MIIYYQNNFRHISVYVVVTRSILKPTDAIIYININLLLTDSKSILIQWLKRELTSHLHTLTHTYYYNKICQY